MGLPFALDQIPQGQDEVDRERLDDGVKGRGRHRVGGGQPNPARRCLGQAEGGPQHCFARVLPEG